MDKKEAEDWLQYTENLSEKEQQNISGLTHILLTVMQVLTPDQVIQFRALMNAINTNDEPNPLGDNINSCLNCDEVGMLNRCISCNAFCCRKCGVLKHKFDFEISDWGSKCNMTKVD